LSAPEGGDKEAVPAEGIELGADPETGEKVTRREGRFGPYLQLGEAVDGEKPKRSSIPKGYNPSEIDLETALKFLSLPREIGTHPESGKPITTNFGRFGPFVLHDGSYATLDSAEEVFTVGINRAVDLLAQKRAKGPRARPGALKDLGPHPDGGGNIQIMSGRFGPYVKHGAVNATLPRDKAPEELTLEEALALIAARAAKGGGGRKPARAAAGKAAKRATKTPAKRATKTPAKRPRKKAAAGAADA